MCETTALQDAIKRQKCADAWGGVLQAGAMQMELDALVADLATARSERDYAHVRADRAQSDYRAIGRSMCVAEYHIIEADAYAENWEMRFDELNWNC